MKLRKHLNVPVAMADIRLFTVLIFMKSATPS